MLTNCARCDTEMPPKLSFSGPHIKSTCAECGKYIKFESLANVPDYRDSKRAIWEITQDLAYIEDKKKASGKYPYFGVTGIERDVSYHNLLVAIILDHV